MSTALVIRQKGLREGGKEGHARVAQEGRRSSRRSIGWAHGAFEVTQYRFVCVTRRLGGAFWLLGCSVGCYSVDDEHAERKVDERPGEGQARARRGACGMDRGPRAEGAGSAARAYRVESEDEAELSLSMSVSRKVKIFATRLQVVAGTGTDIAILSLFPLGCIVRYCSLRTAGRPRCCLEAARCVVADHRALLIAHGSLQQPSTAQEQSQHVTTAKVDATKHLTIQDAGPGRRIHDTGPHR